MQKATHIKLKHRRFYLSNAYLEAGNRSLSNTPPSRFFMPGDLRTRKTTVTRQPYAESLISTFD
ncbi:hypothetical protein LA76x_0609 [Lysobacter antibioticus]|uniref:Uncharacterized protein n=1 Tax=Lysobacter antibioticus TaxID=84531 RepID=A0A0S2F5E3_LYSAN|nr:hypothetical protein LA76x_0609 [Lysobacter antibioticus]